MNFGHWARRSTRCATWSPVRAGRDRAARRRDRRDQRIPDGSVGEDGRARPARHHRAGGGWRRGHGLSRPLRGDGGDQPRLGLGGAFLRRAFQSLRQPASPLGHGRTEGEIPAEAHLRRACRLARHVGAGRGLRRGVDEAQGRKAQRPLRAQRQQDVDHQRAGRLDAGRLRQDRSGRRSARHHRLPDREGHSRVSRRRRSSTSWACAAPTPASWCSRIARCRSRTCSARRARASTC
jgi:hypothetical protein